MELLIGHMCYYGLGMCSHISKGLACLAWIRVGTYTGELFTNKVQARSYYFRKHRPRVLWSWAHAYSTSIFAVAVVHLVSKTNSPSLHPPLLPQTWPRATLVWNHYGWQDQGPMGN